MSVFRIHFNQEHPMALLLARTGMRVGEAVALKWQDIDFEKRLITVRRTFSRGKLGTPKNGKNREVDMSLQLTDVLKRLHQKKKINALKDGSVKISEWVFSNDSGNSVDINNWRKRVFLLGLRSGSTRTLFYKGNGRYLRASRSGWE
jgi:integrase